MAVAASQPPSGPEFEERFLRILNNQSKHERPPSETPRERGFVVLVRGPVGVSLSPFQDLCHNSERQSHNTCFTIRRRLQPTMAIGTLLAAWLKDLQRISSDQGDPLPSDLRPEPASSGWHRIVDELWAPNLLGGSFAPAEESGKIEPHDLDKILKAFSDQSVLKIGERLILFGELSEEATNVAEWTAAVDLLFARLPERLGLVFSGVPRDFHLPTDDPHFLEITVPDNYGGGATGGLLTYKYIDSSFHSDTPADKDELSVTAYANAIARFVLHPQTKPPITIGIHGRWGKGKSSFMKLIDSSLIKHAEINRAENTQKWNDVVEKLLKAESDQAADAYVQLDEAAKQRLQAEHARLKEEERALWQEMTEQAKKNVLSVRFNAWQFEDAKQTWAGLASEISQRLEELLPRHTRQWLKVRYAWRERRSELILNVLLPFVIFLVIAILFGLGFFRGVSVPNPDTPSGALLKLLLPAGSLLTLWYLTSRFVKVAQPISERVLSYVAMPNYREQMGFQHRVRDDLKFVYEFVSTRLNTSINRAGTFRVVVYIDDLDRCSESKIMELLQAINLILADCEFFVFVGMDTEMIYRAINSYYKEKSNDRLADDYLSKIIQISFHLPETKLDKRVRYLSTLFSLSSRIEWAGRATPNGDHAAPQTISETESATFGPGTLPYDLTRLLTIVPVQIKETEDTSHELEAFSDYCDFIDDNPREMKRLVNIHRLIKILVQKPNAPLDADRQKKLVKWLIFCDAWPHLVGNVLQLTDYSDTENCLLDLTQSLEKASKQPQSTEAVPAFDRLGEFATFLPSQHKPDNGKDPDDWGKRVAEERRVYTLSAADIDDEFRLAAHLSLMIRKPTHRG